MNEETMQFVKELAKKPEVSGIILFGSWARGNNHDGSDVDLIVIQEQGYRRAVEHYNAQTFEIIYTTENDALQFWSSHKDDAAELWSVAKIIHDKDGSLTRIKLEVEKMLSTGKSMLTQDEIAHLEFDVRDTVKYILRIMKNEPENANMILNNKIFSLTKIFFDIRQIWLPAPKQRLEAIKIVSTEAYELLKKFYHPHTEIEEKIAITEKLIPIVFLN